MDWLTRQLKKYNGSPHFFTAAGENNECTTLSADSYTWMNNDSIAIIVQMIFQKVAFMFDFF